MVYQRNRYDFYVMTKIVKGKQCTISWHVNDMKILHADSDIVSGVLSDINGDYGKISKMTSTQGKIS